MPGEFLDIAVRHYSTGMYVRLAFATSTTEGPNTGCGRVYLTGLPQRVRRVPEIPIGLESHPELGRHLEQSRQP